ncbi:nucleotidyltransferase family protein [Alteromonas sp. D210916BOD_24]|uniref:nucleotidyltransferase family protein n=1 Tax=Alteromonas sp. D210916BOD_24 TaxID=3157618 RepID=UPI00399C95D2
MTTRLSQQFIVDAFITPSLLKALNVKEWNSLVFVLRKEKMLARFYERIKQVASVEMIPADARRHFSNAALMSEKQNKMAVIEAKGLQTSLSTTADYLVFLKGAGYAIADHVASKGRLYSDIDLVVPKKDLRDVESTLTIFGWIGKELDDYDERYYREWSHEIPPLYHHRRGTVLDVHHNFIPPVSGVKFDIEKFIHNYSHKVGELTILTEPAMFYHSAIHLLLNEDNSSAFRDITDLYLIAHEEPATIFENVMAIAKEFGFEKVCLTAFSILSRRFDITLPVDAQRQISQGLRGVAHIEAKLLEAVTMPKHSDLIEGNLPVYQFLAEVRAHWLKMPIGVLCSHIAVKVYRAIAKSLFGEHIFIDKKDTQA